MDEWSSGLGGTNKLTPKSKMISEPNLISNNPRKELKIAPGATRLKLNRMVMVMDGQGNN